MGLVGWFVNKIGESKGEGLSPLSSPGNYEKLQNSYATKLK